MKFISHGLLLSCTDLGLSKYLSRKNGGPKISNYISSTGSDFNVISIVLCVAFDLSDAWSFEMEDKLRRHVPMNKSMFGSLFCGFQHAFRPLNSVFYYVCPPPKVIFSPKFHSKLSFSQN